MSGKRFVKNRRAMLVALFGLAVYLVVSIPSFATDDSQSANNSSIPVASAISKIFLPLVSNNGSPGVPPVSTNTPTSTPTNTPAITPTSPPSGVTLLVDGDARSGCDPSDYAVAALVSQFPGNTPMLDGGDDTIDGAYSNYTGCFNLAWGPFKSQIYPAPGNHEYVTAGASGYFQYWGAQAHNPLSYYSFDVGAWHIISLNSIIDTSASSAQVAWLKGDLATHTNQCTLAYWHYPLYSSGGHGNNISTQPLYQALYDANADVVINGHDHDYERFAPQNANGQVDNARGIIEFVVGTMGAPHSAIGYMKSNSQVFNNNTWGLVQMTLYPSSYVWKFIPVAGSTFTDSGSANCH